MKKSPKSQTALVARFVLVHEQGSPERTRLQALDVVRRTAGELSPGNFWRVERALKEMKRCMSLLPQQNWRKRSKE